MQPDYQSGPPRMPGPFEGAPVSKWLLIINVAVLFFQILLTGPGEELQESTFYRFGSFSIQDGIYGFEVWRLITFQFLHAGLGHLFANCLGLFFFGPHIERWMSSRVYLTFYLLCGVAGALFYTLLFFLPGFFDAYTPAVQMVGASAGLFGILAAFYFIAPDARILLFFVIPLKMRTFAIGYLIIESLAVIFNWHNAGGSAGHLGGAIFGFAVLKLPPLKEFVIKLSLVGSGTTKKGIRKTRDATVVRESKRSPLELTKEVDRILDKISEEGIQSLTKKEKEILDKARR
jgi:membrane associated rhomboid family serine protease